MNEAMGTDIGTFDGTSPVPAEFEVSLNAPYANLDSIKRYEPSMLAMPGVAEVMASLGLWVNMLMRLDLPTWGQLPLGQPPVDVQVRSTGISSQAYMASS